MKYISLLEIPFWKIMAETNTEEIIILNLKKAEQIVYLFWSWIDLLHTSLSISSFHSNFSVISAESEGHFEK